MRLKTSPAGSDVGNNRVTLDAGLRYRRYDVNTMMVRTQICLDSELQRGARERASALGISLAEYVRRLIDRDIRSRHVTVSPSGLFDLGSSSDSSVAKNKKAMLAEAVTSRHRRTRYLSEQLGVAN